jgi:acetylornithine deacetylase/succinyl-diaminopimelate desuccinylase-like protein
MTNPPASVVELLQALIRIPSVNPDGDPGTEQTGELACAQWVGEFLEHCGVEVTFEDVEDGRPNVIGRFASNPPVDGADPKPRLLFAPHTDTVGVGGMTVEPFGGELRDGKIWGRGASDTKGTMAAMLWALWELRDRIADLGAEVGFVGLMGEETSQFGSKHFAEHHGDEFDFAVVGEPTELDVVHTHKGCVWLSLTTRGRAVHGSQPERGENALMKMLPVLQAIDGEFRERLAGYTHPVLGHSTVNIGNCHSGTRCNIVPDLCVATLDFRTTPDLSAKPGGVQAELENFLVEKGFADFIEVDVLNFSEPLDTDPQNPFVQRFAAMGSELIGAPWFCDAAWLAIGGIPGVAIGPGSIAQAHTIDEHLSVDALESGADFYQRYLEGFA